MTPRWPRTGTASEPAIHRRNASWPRCSGAPLAAGRAPESPMHGGYRPQGSPGSGNHHRHRISVIRASCGLRRWGVLEWGERRAVSYGRARPRPVPPGRAGGEFRLSLLVQGEAHIAEPGAGHSDPFPAIGGLGGCGDVGQSRVQLGQFEAPLGSGIEILNDQASCGPLPERARHMWRVRFAHPTARLSQAVT
jgi:hypothetical protein